MKIAYALCLLLVPSAIACTSSHLIGEDGGNLSLAPSPVPTWEEYLASATPIEGGGYVVETDLSFPSEAALHNYYDELTRTDANKAHVFTQLATSNWLVWPAHKIVNIRYCVSTTFDGFDGGNYYAVAVQKMATAAAEWEAIANIKFTYLSAHDVNCIAANSAIDIAVRPQSAGGSACASPPFDNWNLSFGTAPTIGCGPKILGVVHIKDDGAYAGSTLGVFRHEIGHTLGFRHEHPWGVVHPSCEQQSYPDAGFGGAVAGDVAYDSLSVMQYPGSAAGGFCAWGPNADYILSTQDGISARVVYGMPASWYVAAGVI